VWLWELLEQHVIHHPTLAEVPESYPRYWQRLGIDAIWLMGVWEASDYSARIGRQDRGLLAAFQHHLDDFTPVDCIGSPYAVRQYVVSFSLGDTEGLQRFRQSPQAANIGLLLDFVPNHTACDHPWVERHPAYYIQGSHADALRAPSEYFYVASTASITYMAHGRDPYFPPWTDTAQLNYFNSDVHLAMREELLRLAEWCDGAVIWLCYVYPMSSLGRGAT
jgi:glycosidase